jgi:hypothetical protein
MNDPIPSAREGLEDKLRTVIERQNDRRLHEHHDIRLLHPKTGSGMCRTCRVAAPCPTMRIIDGEAVA